MKALAWPVVAVWLGLKYRTPVTKLLERTRKVKAPGFEGEFDVPKLEPLKPEDPRPGDTQALPAPEQPPQSEPQPPELNVPIAERDLIEHAPAGAVINSWARFEHVVRYEAVRVGVPVANLDRRTISSLLTALRDNGALDATEFEVASELRVLRNEVVHALAKPSVEDAEDFHDTTQELIRRLENGADRVRMAKMLAELHAESSIEVTVGMLPSGGIGSALENAEAAMLARRGKWAVVHNGIRMMISERDAALLIRGGARLKNDPESDR